MNVRKAFLTLALLVLAATGAPAQQPAPKPAVDLGALTKEVMALQIDGGQQSLVMWTPYEFFLAAGTAGGAMSHEAAERELGFLRSYITMFVMSSFERPDGTEVYATEAETRSRAALRLDDGTEVAPLTVTPPKMSAIITMMKSLMAAQGGADRKNMHVLVFPAVTDRGRTVVDTARKDKLTLALKPAGRFGAASFTWRTPFDAVARVPDCQRCKAGLSAKWSYCPYCGQKLSQ